MDAIVIPPVVSMETDGMATAPGLAMTVLAGTAIGILLWGRRPRTSRRPMWWVMLVVGIVVALMSSAGATASARSQESWSRLTPTLINFAEVGLARGPDGVLHVVWSQDDGATDSLRHQAILANGKLARRPSSIVSGWRSLQASPDVAVGPDDRLHVVFAGLHSSTNADPLNGPVHTTERAPDGRSWSSPRRASDRNGYAAAGLSVGAAQDGGLVVAQGDPGNAYRFVGKNNSDVAVDEACCVRGPRIAVDAASGQVVLGWSKGSGFYVQAISRKGFAGARRPAPDSDYTDQRTAITGRLGAPGIFLAYRSRDEGSIKLWRFGAAAPKVVARGEDVFSVGISPAPEGRLWVFWESGERYYAMRSNRAATRFGEAISVAPPSGTLITTYGLFGEGSRGPLDLLAHVQTGPRHLATWHTQLLPRLELACTSGRLVTCRVSDAGDAVPRASVRVGSRRLLTNAQGRISGRLPAGNHRVVASKAGYALVATVVKGTGA